MLEYNHIFEQKKLELLILRYNFFTLVKSSSANGSPPKQRHVSFTIIVNVWTVWGITSSLLDN